MQVYMHVYRHLYGHVYGHMCGHVDMHAYRLRKLANTATPHETMSKLRVVVGTLVEKLTGLLVQVRRLRAAHA